MAEGRVAVVGGGIAGLTAAYRLREAGFQVTVFEARDRPGGRLWSVRKGDFLMDLGAAFYLGTYKDTLALIRELGLTAGFSDLPAMGAIPRDGVLHHLDYTKLVRCGLTTRALSVRAKLRMAKLALLVGRSWGGLGYDTYAGLAAVDTETVRKYARRELGPELHEYFARPLVSGAWVADDAATSLTLCLWTARNLLNPNIYNLDTGIATLPLELARRVETRLGAKVLDVTETGAGVDVTVEPGQTEQYDACVIATQAQHALAIHPGMDANTRALYETTEYRRLGCVCLGLARRPTDPATYVLAPPRDWPDTIAVIADHNKARCRAPDGKGLLSVLLSHEYLEASDHLSDEQVLEHAIGIAERYHGPLADDLEEHAVVRWPESVPALPPGRFRLIERYHRDLDRTARVQFASDLDRIPGLNGALMSGQDAARRVAAVLQAHARPRLADIQETVL